MSDIIINSPLDFYNLIKNRESIIQTSPDLVKFRDYMYLYITGCQCDSDLNFKKATHLYKSLNKTNLSRLKSILQCKMIFNLSGIYLFEV